MPPVQDTLTVDGVAFAVRWSRRRRTIGITIPRQGAPVVAAPAGCRRVVLESAVRGKLSWVRRKLGERAALSQLAPQRRYVAGETFPYLGRRYRLVLTDDRDEGAIAPLSDARRRPGLALRRGCFELPRSLAGQGRECFEAWYRERATDILAARVAHFAPLCGVAPPVVRTREMRSRWGSCSSGGRVSLCWALVLLPCDLVDYVVVHELVHLGEMNHGHEFWRGVERVLPDYRERRARLRAQGPRVVT